MQSLSRFLNDAQMAWLTSSISCCVADGDVGDCGPEKSMRIVNGQPQLISPPTLQQPFERPDTATAFERPQTRGRELTARGQSRASNRSFSLKRSLSSRQSNRLQISAPYNFQHHTETSYVREPEKVVVRQDPKLRPLELSIYLPGNGLSPLPEFGPRELTHMRSESALSLRVPRKPVLSTVIERRSMSTEELLNALVNDLPNPTPRTRMRSNTEPPAYERVKSALLEKIELDQKLKEIDEAIERQSIYLSSRPGSRASRVESRLDKHESIYSESTEPMPLITDKVLSRANSNQRPKTAPTRPRRLKSMDSSLRAPPLLKERPLPPPLPLVLQTPPLPQRKKSISRVSSWLFPGSATMSEHSRHMSLDSVTTQPRPLTSKEGFYQCVEVKELESPQSFSSVSSMRSGEATSWSSPSLGVRISVDSKRGGTFGNKDEEARWSMTYDGMDGVGVAF